MIRHDRNDLAISSWDRCEAVMVHSVFLYPVEGALDVASIERFLAQRPDVVVDPLGTGIYMVCGLLEAVEVYRDRRLEDPSEFPYMVLVTVKPEWVNVFQEYGDEDGLRSALDIVSWMIQHNHVRVMDEYQEDWTDKVAKEGVRGVRVLYPEQLTWPRSCQPCQSPA